MARGKKQDSKTIIDIMTSYTMTNSFTETAKELGMPITTVESVYKANKDNPKFAKAREKIENKFVNRATSVIDKTLDVIEQKLNEAVEDNDIRKYTRLSELASLINTLYDKRALAKGESTQNENIEVNIKIV